MKKRIILLSLLILCAQAVVAAAAASDWRIDHDHSTVNFKVRHIFTMIPGEFSEFSGNIDFDPEKPESSVFDFTIDVRSIETGVAKRDGHLLSEDFFAVKRYPEIRFKSTAVRRMGEGDFALDGELTLKDVTQKVTLPLTFHGSKKHPLKKGVDVGGFESVFTLDRLEYNVGSGKFYDMGVVDRTVIMEIFLEVLQDS